MSLDSFQQQEFGGLFSKAHIPSRDTLEVVEGVAKSKLAAHILCRNARAQSPENALRRFAMTQLWSTTGKNKYVIMIMEIQEVGNLIFSGQLRGFTGFAED